MRYTINRLVNQETHLRYFRLHSLLTNLALQHGEKLSATRLASLPVIATARKPSAVKAAASAALSLARPAWGVAALIYHIRGAETKYLSARAARKPMSD
jgi:hypothetical protein